MRLRSRTGSSALAAMGFAMPLWLGAGVTPASAPFDASTVLTLTLSPASVVGGNPVTGTVTLSAPAPARLP